MFGSVVFLLNGNMLDTEVAGGNAGGVQERSVNVPAPIRVELLPYSVDWPRLAQEETLRLLQALEKKLVEVHHIGSTAIPGIHAKPIIDLMPVVRTIGTLDEQQSALQRLGYEYWGEYGIPGRRYCTFDDPATGRRKFQLHCFELGSEEIARHLAFRDYLRANPLLATEYDAEKRRCRGIHPDDSHAYSDAKADWIGAQLPAALAYFARQGGAAHGLL
jgi:GrpB-like predicted nucleotidyltransferase (UPF0157 family)